MSDSSSYLFFIHVLFIQFLNCCRELLYCVHETLEDASTTTEAPSIQENFQHTFKVNVSYNGWLGGVVVKMSDL